MAELPKDSPTPLVDARWLRITRLAALAPIALALAYSLWPSKFGPRTGCSEDFSLISNILWLATPPYVISLVHLLGRSAQRLKKGLAWAVVAGSIWGAISLFIVLAEVFGGSARYAAIPLISTAIQITLVTSAIKTYYSGHREKGDEGVLSKRVPLFMSYLLFFGAIFFAMPDFYATKRGGRAASAVAALRKINSAQASYARAYPQGFSPTLAALGPPPGGSAPSASAAGLIDRDLASGARNEYIFRYIPGARDAAGKTTTYTLTATPQEPECTLWRQFLTDQTGTIHASENRPATVDDPEY
jgi:hypothetical protein